MNSFVLHMEGALAGWGTSASTFYYRDTAEYPKKRHVVGLLSAAMGYNRGDPRIKELSDAIDMDIMYDYSDKGDILKDFCSIYNDKTYVYNYDGKPEQVKIPQANGTKSRNGRIFHKWYRVCPRYNIRISSKDDKLIDELVESVEDPCYPMFLGRKCCVGNVYVISCDEELELQKNSNRK